METKYYIKKRGAYYGPNHKGYTSDFIYAGIYTQVDAQAECDSCSECFMIEVDEFERNSEIRKRIAELGKQLI